MLGKPSKRRQIGAHWHARARTGRGTHHETPNRREFVPVRRACVRAGANRAASTSGGTDTPGVYYGDVSGNDADKATTVHGSFTTGIGYTKGYGTSTMNAAELDISSQYGDGKTFDMRINVQQSRGLPGAYYGYGSRYRGY